MEWNRQYRQGMQMEQGAGLREMDFGQATATVTANGRVRHRSFPDVRSVAAHVSVRSNRQAESEARAYSVAETSRTGEVLIRLLDIVGSLAILIFSLPVMIVAALFVKLTSRGPVLYKQERVGKGGKIFALHKFRTMVPDAEKHVGPVWATRDDDRVTPVGRILRKMRVDELPQLYNVLRGDMSLVGPRPERPFFVERHEALQGIRLSVKPGLTGLAQVRAFYDIKPHHKMKYDYLYIQRRSLLLNTYILLRTIPALFTRMGW